MDSSRPEPFPETVRPFTQDEARRFTEQIRADVQALWLKVVEAYERRAWAALGYASFAAYMREEFQYGKSHAYRMLDAGHVVRALTPPPVLSPQLGTGSLREVLDDRRDALPADDWTVRGRLREDASVPPPTHEAQARELKPILNQRGPEALVETWEAIVEAYGPDVTGAEVRRIVRARLEVTTPPEQRLSARLREFNRELRAFASGADRLTCLIDGGELRFTRVTAGEEITSAMLAETELIEQWREQTQETLMVLFRVERLLGEGIDDRPET